MTDTAVVAPPDTSVWWDEAATAAAALDQLRLGDADVDAGRVVSAVGAAGQSINQYLDRDPVDAFTVLTAPLDLLDALVQVTIEYYRRKDAPPMSVDGMMAGGWRPQSFDPLAGVRSILDKYRTRRGMG